MAAPSLFTTPLIVVNWLFPVLSTTAVGLRFYARKSSRGFSPFADDWIVLAALIFCWAITINTIVGAAQAGIDHDKPSLSPHRAGQITARVLWTEGFLLMTALALVKISILHFYYRIFVSKAGTMYKQSIIITHVVIASWWLSSAVCQFLVTDPFWAAWNPTIPFKYRYSYNTWTVVFAGLSIFFDVVILLFPLPKIGKLRMDFSRKVSVMGIFWLGAFCCIAAAVRFYYLYKGIYKVTSEESTNPYVNVTAGIIWAHVEPNCSVIAACLPCYGIFFRKGRTAHSFVLSFRDRFTISSRSNPTSGSSRKTMPKNTNMEGGDSQSNLTRGVDVNEYYELREQEEGKRGIFGNSRSIVVGETTGDADNERRTWGGIGVTREFTTERFPR